MKHMWQNTNFSFRGFVTGNELQPVLSLSICAIVKNTFKYLLFLFAIYRLNTKTFYVYIFLVLKIFRPHFKDEIRNHTQTVELKTDQRQNFNIFRRNKVRLFFASI